MASGFSYGGGRARCFAYWQEFQQCYIKSDDPVTCVPQKADYLECLHHQKEIKRMQVIQAVQYEKQRLAAQEQAKEAAEHPPPAS
ncbi:hypothetical protein M413DRAFT_440331 [Hebeloma cylindrosporum]|uniref:NADH dehydrogenase [ubiquinone] iron-sulfur protein 5 n=1 Tax=Hebeloma cylindrosporum TaxID=76867 RepID=A0A0C2YA96_HEBCY|nr:hypothetical protein M413DRAFT_440331 [Hebeloma cylindrosporum h7]